MLRVVLLFIPCLPAFAFQGSIADFLENLLNDPRKEPSYEEGLQIADLARSASPGSVAGSLPIVFRALQNDRDAVKMNAALILHAVSLRPDASGLLDRHVPELLALLKRSDERLQLTAPAVLIGLRSRYKETIPAFQAFLQDSSQKPRVRSALTCTLLQMEPPSRETKKALAAFLAQPLSTRDRIEALNAITCQVWNDPEIAELVAKSLADPEADVRAKAISSIGRLGPDAVAVSQSMLLAIANRESERSDVRAIAQRVVERGGRP
jgi:hypothetical protein